MSDIVSSIPSQIEVVLTEVKLPNVKLKPEYRIVSYLGEKKCMREQLEMINTFKRKGNVVRRAVSICTHSLAQTMRRRKMDRE